MAIAVDELESPGWWLQRLSRELHDTKRQRRLKLLDDHFRGEPPLPEGAENAKRAYQAFQKKARVNLARLLVQAVRQRMNPTGFRTAAENDENGDPAAWRLWKSLGMAVKFSDVLRSFLVMGEGYMIVGVDEQVNEAGEVVSRMPVVTAEDARQVITAHDPVTGEVIAALKMFHDPVATRDLAYLFLPGELHVAYREGKRAGGSKFSPQTWDWDDELSAELPEGLEDVIPVVRLLNEDGFGEFEPHLADLDRINHMILQRMVIATMQAFKQRAIKGDLPEFYPADHPTKAGQPIDYDGVFTADPGALWELPEGVDIWESGQVDLTGILSAVKEDVRLLSAASQTPLTMFNPESANQTAEGAVSAREDFVFKVEDRRTRAELGLADVMAMVYRLMGGEEQRASRADIEVIWAPAERHSLAERADAAAKAKGTLPRRAILTEVWQLRPEVVDRYDDDLKAEQDEAVLALSSGLDFGPRLVPDADAV